MHTWMSKCILTVLLEVVMKLLLIHTRVLASWNQDWQLSWKIHLRNCSTGIGNIQWCIKTFCTYNTCQKKIDAWQGCMIVANNSLQAFGKSMFTNCTHALNQLTLVVIYIIFIFLRTVWTFITTLSGLMGEYKLVSMKLAISQLNLVRTLHIS